MCMSSKPVVQAAPKAPATRPPPQRDEQAAATTQARRRVREQSGSYNNVFTSALGDTGYGQNVASFGA